MKMIACKRATRHSLEKLSICVISDQSQWVQKKFWTKNLGALHSNYNRVIEVCSANKNQGKVRSLSWLASIKKYLLDPKYVKGISLSIYYTHT